jgi:hypothetical protein
VRRANARVCCSRLNCQNVSGSSSCRHSGPKPNLKDETDHLARWPMSGHGNAGGCLPANSPELKTRIPRQTVARTRVNEKDALGDGSRDSISGGNYTELWCRAHITKREGVSVGISNSATRERQGRVNVNTVAALSPTRA